LPNDPAPPIDLAARLPRFLIGSADAARRFQQGGYDGLAVICSGEWTPEDLSLDLPGPRLLQFTGRLRNDLDAFRIDTLEDLTRVTGCRHRIPDVAQPRLRQLYRPAGSGGA
jgi:hypothetical protein